MNEVKYFLVSLVRVVKRGKTSFSINLVGLSIGLTCSLLTYLWVNDEIAVDKFHEHDDRLYQVMRRNQSEGNIEVSRLTPGVLADALEKEMPEVEHAVNIAYSQHENTISIDEKSIKGTGIYSSQDIFEIFSFNLIQGDKSKVLADRGNIVVSKNFALKLFGTIDNILGKTVTFDGSEQHSVSGVFDPNSKSTIKFDFVLQLPLFEEHYRPIKFSWDNHSPDTYVLLVKGAEVALLNNKLDSLLKAKAGDNLNTLFARKFSDGYLYNNYENGVQSGGRILYVKIFSITAIFILIVACINFMNLSTALASQRGRQKGIGIRKLLGAERRSLIFQQLGESTIMAFLSFFISLMLVGLLLPFFNELADKQISLTFSAEIIFTFVGITLLTGLFAGIYPALYISGFDPMMALKENTSSTFRVLWIREGLVILQFTLTIVLLVAMFVGHNQFELIQTTNLGYKKDNIIVFDLEGNSKIHRETFLSEVSKVSGVQQASSLSEIQSFFGDHSNTWGVSWPQKDPDTKVTMHYRIVDYGFVELMGMEMKDGRSFSKDFTSDLPGIIFNETAIEVMGLGSNAVGTKVKFGGMELEIIGVVKNFYFESLHGDVKPLFMMLFPKALNTVVLKVSGDKLAQTLNGLGKFYTDFNPGFPFSYNFFDEDFQKLYGAEKKVSVLSWCFAGLAIVITCLGLVGLTAFTIEKRKKEISTRKVLGSSRMQIMFLLYSDALKLLVISLLLGLPTSYFLAKHWLENFVTRIELEAWVFIAATGITFGLILLAVGSQAIKALSINPAQSLKGD